MTVRDYWTSGRGLAHITPPGNLWPEGEKFKIYYPDIFFGQDVIEFGCGTGRLAQFFSKRRYTGVDISAKAIEIAKRDNPGYDFAVLGNNDPIWGGGDRVEHVAFAHNVMMHVADEELVPTATRFQQKRLIISEITGREWRREGEPPVFNREIEEYERAFRSIGYSLRRVQFKPCENYRPRGRAVDLTIMEFHRA